MALTRAIPYVRTLELGRPKDAFAGDRVIQIGPDRVRDITEDESMNPDRFAFRRGARTVETMTPIDAFFGMQEQYKAATCSSGDRQISCAEKTRTEFVTFTCLLGVPPGCTRIGLFQCGCNRETSTGERECTCERAAAEVPLPPPEGPTGFAPGPVPVGAIGTRVISQDGAPGGGTLRTVLILVGIIAVGYFLYTRYVTKKAVAAA